MYTNAHGQGKLKLLQITSGYSVDVIYAQDMAERRYAYNNKSLSCSYSDTLRSGNLLLYKVVLIYNYFDYKGALTIKNIQLSFDIVNMDGKTNGRELLPELIHYTSIDELVEAVKQYDGDDSVIAYIGTERYEERVALSDILVKQDKILFTVNPSGGEETYENILLMNPIPNQRIPVFIHNTVQAGRSLAFVYNENNTYYIYIFSDSRNTMTYAKLYCTQLDIDIKIIKYNFNEDEIMVDIDAIDNTAVAVLIYLGNYTERFLNEKGKSTKIVPVIVDFSEDMVFNAEDSTSFSDTYGMSTFIYTLDTNEMNIYIKKIEQYKGDAKKIINNIQMSAYVSLLMLQSAVAANPNDLSAKTLKSYFYVNQISTPIGDVILFKSNCIAVPSYIINIKDEDFTNYANTIELIYPEPYFYLNHDNIYYTSDYSVEPIQEFIESSHFGIAFILDISNIKEKHGHLSYLMAKEYIAELNNDGGVKNLFIKDELHDCPKDSDSASSLLMRLYERGFKVIIGGCNEETKKNLLTSINNLNMLFLYTGFNIGNECEKNIFYTGLSPYQELMSSISYYLYNVGTAPCLLYTNDDKYKYRIQYIKSIFESVGLDIIYEGSITNEIDIDNHLIEISHLADEGTYTIIFSEYSEVEKIFERHEMLVCSLYDDKEKCHEYYPLLIFDQTHMTYKNNINSGHHAAGHHIVTALLDDQTEGIINFINVYSQLGNNITLPNYYDISVSVSTVLTLTALKDASTSEIADVKSQLYLSLADTPVGKIKFSENNHIEQPIFYGVIAPNGYLLLETTLTQAMSPDPYIVELNRKYVYKCNWRDDIGGNYSVETINIGVVFPPDSKYFESAISYYVSILVSADEINVAGGFNGLHYNVISIAVKNGDIPSTIQEYSEEYNIKYFFGGWITTLRTELHKAVKSVNGYVFYPVDYEGKECYDHALYYGIPANSYVYYKYILVYNCILDIIT